MKLSEDRIRHLSKLIIDEFDKIEMLDYNVDPNDIRLKIVELLKKEMEKDDEISNKVLEQMRNSASKQYLLEGSMEWKAEFEQMFHREMMRMRGFGE